MQTTAPTGAQRYLDADGFNRLLVPAFSHVHQAVHFLHAAPLTVHTRFAAVALHNCDLKLLMSEFTD